MKKIIVFLCAILLCSPVFSAENNTGAGANVSQLSMIKKYKDISHNPIVLGKMKEQTRNLSNEEKNVIKKYVFGAVRGENTYLLINCNLRGNLDKFIPKKEITKPLKYRLDYYANQLSAPIAKTRVPKNIILYRGVDDKGIKLIFANKKVDEYVAKPVNDENLKMLKDRLISATYVEKGFMSTSYDINCTKKTKFRFEVNTPKNMQAALIEDLGKKNEKEVLINRNTKWKVTDISVKTDKKTKKDYYLISVKYIIGKY